jgi:hypothetical protein
MFEYYQYSACMFTLCFTCTRSRPPDDTWQLKIYELLEVPKSSRPARVISIASIALVVFSVATVCKLSPWVLLYCC